MAELVAVPLDNGGEVVVEMDDVEVGVVKAGRPGQIVGRATQSLQEALESVTPAAKAILDKLRPASPNEIEVEFQLMLTAEAGAIIAKTSSECHLKVTLSWKSSGDGVA